MTMFMGMTGLSMPLAALVALGPARGVGKDAQGAECGVDGLGHLHLLFLIGLGEGVEDDEEAEEQGDEVGIGDQPAVRLILLLRRSSRLMPRAPSFPAASSMKPASLTSSMRGFMPSRMEMTPSSIISRRWCSSRMRMRILPAKGKKEEIGDAHAVDGGDEGHGDAFAHLLNIVKMLHDLNESQHRAQDADGGREASGRLEDHGEPFLVLHGESRLTRMILRSSLGSVPSTASMRDRLRNGSWMVCRSASRLTTPLRRALLAKATSRRISSSFCLRGAEKTCARLRNAARPW
jgi:hypothetical protein